MQTILPITTLFYILLTNAHFLFTKVNESKFTTKILYKRKILTNIMPL